MSMKSLSRDNIKRLASLILTLCLLMSFCGCNSKSCSQPNLNLDTSGRENKYTFASAESEELELSKDGLNDILSVVEGQKTEYEYSDLYALDEVKKRLDFDVSVDNHKHNALNEVGVLDADHLALLVAENNNAFLAEENFGYENVDAEYIKQICTLIVDIVNEMQSRYPEIDWDRVYCNLSNMKILYNVGMLSYAEVSKDMVLSISKNNTEIVLNMKGENGLRNVLVHETMHIIQLGCECEDIEHCDRRAGISVYWDDFTLNTTDWTWFVEGSAERNMCNLTGEDATTYQYKMDYICSFTMSVLLKESIEADTMETLCFYSDPDMLFDAFSCETQEQKDEILNMMITMEVLQMQPEAFFLELIEETGVDPRETEDSLNQFCYTLKPSVCVTLSKEFYENLSHHIYENGISVNDLCFLITLFEGHINQHLDYDDASKAEINKVFVDSYIPMREALFELLKSENEGINLEEMYSQYIIFDKETDTLNADLNFLPGDKKDFLAERAQWQNDLFGLGEKLIVE